MGFQLSIISSFPSSVAKPSGACGAILSIEYPNLGKLLKAAESW